MAKTVLVTRPEPQGNSLCEELRTRGYQVEHVPVMATEALQDAVSCERIRNCFERLSDYDACVVVSLNAAEQALTQWMRYPLSGQAVYSVGKSTADFLQRSELWRNRAPVIYPAQKMDSEGLLALVELSPECVAGKRFLILRGEGGRELIAETLRERGARVESCELYRRILPSEKCRALQAALPGSDILVINSAESLQNFLTMAGKVAVSEKTLVVPGVRVADAARAAGFHHIIVAANATDAAIVEALRGQYAD